ncbi:hypothetical protein F1D05_32505 [Kribbella qitaiheensis]|uniref:Uncharacterized protein n=1 Tax=Kribbella qitaiheensis TaxID=1544730 RepID=A0A7G6X6B7_9ACTN|nr:hypothetical protein [Kribbella qitaiheensis]QNE21782.1 hypothetical protein F1D05_32505 [Kribbella qitaiheensis]
MKTNDFEGEVTIDVGEGGRTRNKVVGGKKDGSGADGVADMIIWGRGKDAGIIYVYEVKPANEYGYTGVAQLQRYVDQLGENASGSSCASRGRSRGGTLRIA